MPQIKCFNCDKPGYKRSECRSKPNDGTGNPPVATVTSQVAQQLVAKPLVCYKCGKPGHIAMRCTSGGSQADGGGKSEGTRAHITGARVASAREAIARFVVICACGAAVQCGGAVRRRQAAEDAPTYDGSYPPSREPLRAS
ncbi:cellular nucleic acid-binding protein homolog [Manduca sexta]|uniref:cellular nucleic acid-binding protein homolog n=1 Tax=Manduca sexta TaxID=7130 RepID=UPI00188E7C4C|nr:cellular nucleic acid-binding protein homolog [Manduca sexta]